MKQIQYLRIGYLSSIILLAVTFNFMTYHSDMKCFVYLQFEVPD